MKFSNLKYEYKVMLCYFVRQKERILLKIEIIQEKNEK